MERRDFLKLSAAAALQAGVLASGFPFVSKAWATKKNNFAYMSATEQIRRFKTGTLSPVDILKAQMEQIKLYNGPLNTTGEALKDYMSFNGKVNGITYEHFEEALVAAQESEKRYKNGTARPLEGITVAIKDELNVKGWRVTQGAVGLKDAPLCKDDHPVIEMLREAGAVMHIQTTVPEFFLNTQTWTKLWGVTRNPWNLHYAVGGSSGGAGATLAAGFTTLAIGSDIGGSIRIPSAFCGLYGFKPPFGRVPTSETPHETYGPMARTFGDMVLMQNSIAGPHYKIHSSLRPKLDYPEKYESLKGVRIALDYFSAWSKDGIDPSIREALSKAAHVLRDQGAIVDEINMDGTHEFLMKVFVDSLSATASAAEMRGVEKLPELTSYAEMSAKLMGQRSAQDIINADKTITELQALLQQTVFEKGYTALIMPTLSTPYIPADFDPSKIEGNTSPAGISFALTYPWNLLSRYPVVNAPIGIAPNNVPMGMQIVGNTFDDLAAFRVAAGYAEGGAHLYAGGMFPDYRNKI